MNKLDKSESSRKETEFLQKPIGRRNFIDYLLGVSAFATFAAIIYPIFRFMVPPQIVEAQQNSVIAGTTTELANNSGKVFKFGSKPGIVIRTEAGELRAFTAICTHLSCTVQYRPNEKDIWCACHNGVYDLTGKNVSGPPPRPLEKYVVNVNGDQINVSKT